MTENRLFILYLLLECLLTNIMPNLRFIFYSYILGFFKNQLKNTFLMIDFNQLYKEDAFHLHMIIII